MQGNRIRTPLSLTLNPHKMFSPEFGYWPFCFLDHQCCLPMPTRMLPYTPFSFHGLPRCLRRPFLFGFIHPQPLSAYLTIYVEAMHARAALILSCLPSFLLSFCDVYVHVPQVATQQLREEPPVECLSILRALALELSHQHVSASGCHFNG